jgi:Ca-activated chloride channel family protein
MQVVWLTPEAALVGLAAAVPLAAWLLGERRVRRTRVALGLRPPRRGTVWAPLLIAAALALVAVAAAQPVLASSGGRPSTRTGQLFVVLDTSRSMLAGRPTRYARAVALAERARDELRGTPVGLASMTDRVLPHIFPSIDRDDYLATLHESLGIERPPPARVRSRASGFDALAALGSARFFTNSEGARVALVLTDGESRAFGAGGVARALARAHVAVVLVRFWRDGERIAGDSIYRADPASELDVQVLGSALRARVFGEGDAGGAVEAVSRALGGDERRQPPKASATARPLAPYATLGALLPLGLLLWRRNVR